MIVVAQRSDLELPEYLAFNSEYPETSHPRWGLGFAFTQARLTNTSAVLDCSSESAYLEKQIARLFPSVQYERQVSDGGFDRVICVDTLDHRSNAEQQRIISEMARWLKPEGLLIFTGSAGPGNEKPDWLRLCAENDLHPSRGDLNDLSPRTTDSVSQIGAVFCKSPGIDFAGKVIGLGMLSWNLRDVARDSLLALIREAEMLQRLGHSPFLCVCDNGSSDGTAEALVSLDEIVDVPHRFIMNQENRGNAVARNQIIECMLDNGVDYIFFIDGDAEIVPFSTFAMLRYMENSNTQVASLGLSRFGETVETLDRDEASKCFFSVDENVVETSQLIAPTWYGIYPRIIFEEGIRFEENPPFNGPGWGFEDNELAFQIVTKGYSIHLFTGMIVLHRAPYSSIHIMRDLGIDARRLYYLRKQYVIDKWAGSPRIKDGPLKVIEECEFPVPS
jgi:SAM-dependent methyltransferase